MPEASSRYIEDQVANFMIYKECVHINAYSRRRALLVYSPRLRFQMMLIVFQRH